MSIEKSKTKINDELYISGKTQYHKDVEISQTSL